MARLVTFWGGVQGVGFRATAAAIARRHPVRGWVRNLPDGRVEMLVDGDEDAIQGFIAAVRARMAHHIDKLTVEEHAVSEPLEGFHIVS
jgi:acylphosphatase